MTPLDVVLCFGGSFANFCVTRILRHGSHSTGKATGRDTGCLQKMGSQQGAQGALTVPLSVAMPSRKAGSGSVRLPQPLWLSPHLLDEGSGVLAPPKGFADLQAVGRPGRLALRLGGVLPGWGGRLERAFLGAFQMRWLCHGPRAWLPSGGS